MMDIWRFPELGGTPQSSISNDGIFHETIQRFGGITHDELETPIFIITWLLKMAIYS